MMAESEEQLNRMVMTFRVSELQMLLGYAGKNKTGRKNELQSRALDVVRLRVPSIQQKIRELYKSIQLEMMSFGDRSQVAAGVQAGSLLQNQRVSSGLSPSLPSSYSQQQATVNTTGYSSRNSSQVSAIGTNTGYTSIQASHNNSFPLSPDVRLKKLPFYDVLGELLKPSTLAPQGSGRYQEAGFNFCLTPQQANKISHSRDLRPGRQDYTVQVQMRFCLLETTSEQEDNFPPNITVKINEKMCPLPSPIPTNKPGVEPKRPSRPVNLTPLCKISPTVTNRIHVSWSSEYGRCYVISVYLVQKLTSEDLLQRLKTKGPRIADFTRSLIKLKLREDGEIATTSLRCSLLCPLGKMRMVLPCRAETCVHLQCFDASLYLLMNERKPTWTCPVCDKPAFYDHLVIDGYFQDVLMADSECTEVTLQKDGGWTPLVAKKEGKEPQQQQQQQHQRTENPKAEVSIETLSDDSDNDTTNSSEVEEVCKKRKKNADVEIITLDSEDEDAEPPSKRPNRDTSRRRSSEGGSSSSTIPRATVNGSGTPTSSSQNGSTTTAGASAATDGTTSNGSTQAGLTDNGVSQPATSPGSNRSSSPQIICLDSPTTSPQPPQQSSQDSMNDYLSKAANNSSEDLSHSLPSSFSSSLHSSAVTGQQGEAISAEGTVSNTLQQHLSQMASESLSGSASSLSPYNLLQDPLTTSNYGGLLPLSTSAATSAYSMNSASIPNLFNSMMASNVSPPPNSGINYRPHDPYL